MITWNPGAISGEEKRRFPGVGVEGEGEKEKGGRRVGWDAVPSCQKWKSIYQFRQLSGRSVSSIDTVAQAVQLPLKVLLRAMI